MTEATNQNQNQNQNRWGHRLRSVVDISISVISSILFPSGEDPEEMSVVGTVSSHEKREGMDIITLRGMDDVFTANASDVVGVEPDGFYSPGTDVVIRYTRPLYECRMKSIDVYEEELVI